MCHIFHAVTWHRADVVEATQTVEVQLEGGGPWSPVPGVTIIHTPVGASGSYPWS